MDTSLFNKGSADPFVEVDIGGLKIKSKTVDSSLNPVWNQALLIPVIYPCVIDTMVISLMDYDAIGKNEYIGSLLVKMSDVFSNKLALPFWAEIYGSHENATNKEEKRKQNIYPQLGKGRYFCR